MALPGITNDEAGAIQVLTDYYSAFSTLELQAVLPYFHEPCLLLGPQGVYAAPTRAALEAVFTPAIDGLRARGYGRSELSLRQVKSLGATAILATGVALRYKLDGQELDRVGVTYVLHKADDRWRIAVLIVGE
jgi:ketosteroid isomerase-like protein